MHESQRDFTKPIANNQDKKHEMGVSSDLSKYLEIITSDS